MKKFHLILSLLMATSAVAALAPTTDQTDGHKTGRASSLLDTYYELDVGDGATNPRIDANKTDKKPRIKSDRVKIGRGLGENVDLEADVGAGAGNGRLRYNFATGEWEFSNDGSLYQPFGSGSGGAAYDPNDMRRSLHDLEVGASQPRYFNQIADAYSTSLGTLTNVSVSGSRLALNAGQTAGSQERVKQFTKDSSSVQAITNIAAQAIAPKATTIASNTIVFDGDVCEFFPASKVVLFAKEFTSDAEMVHEYLKDADGMVARLTRDTCSFNGGTNESTLVVLNPDALDLDFDLLAAAYPTNLRVIPFDYMLSAKASAAASYDQLSLVDAQTTGALRIPAEVLDSFTIRSGTLTGSVIRHSIACSPNGTYCMGIALEQQATSSGTYHFYYSSNAGITWTKYAYTESIAASSSITEDRLYGYLGTPQVIVADNGKSFAIFNSYNGTVGVHVKGVYSDISSGSPVVTQSAATGVDAENSVGTAGYVCANTTLNRQGWMDGDQTDLSFIAIACARDSDAIGAFRFYTNGGATYQNSDLATIPTHHYGSRFGVVVVGSGSSHRTYFIKKSATTNIFTYWYDQPSNSAAGSSTIASGDYYLYDCDASSMKAYCLVRDNSTDSPQYFSWNVTGTPTFSSLKTLTNLLDVDEYIGLDTIENSAAQAYNYGRIPGPQVIINPSDSNHVFFMTDLMHTDGVVRPLLTEVRDDTQFVGIGPSNSTTGGSQNQGYNAASQRIGQTFTTTFNRLRGFSFRAKQQGVIPYGNTLTCELYATSGGLPTGAAIATSNNSYEERYISNDVNYRQLFCEFDEAVSASTVYAVVLTTTHPLSTTNFINLPSGAGYGGGNGVRWDGSAWNNTGDDIVFEVSGEWQYDLSQPSEKFRGDTNLTTWQTDSALSKTPTAGVLSLTTKVSPVGGTAAARRQSGHTFKGTMTMGSGSTPSTVSALSALGYPAATFQPGMVFQTQPGTTESSRKDAITGVVSSTEKAEDRSGMNATAVYTGVTYRSEAGCDSGQAIVFDASGDKVDYGTGTLGVYNVLQSGTKFSIEAQFVLDTLPSVKGFISNIVSQYLEPAATGWLFYVNTSNRLQFQIVNTGSSTTGSSTTFTTGVVYRVKVTGDGSTVRLYVHNGSTWVEETYSSQNTTPYNDTATTNPLEIGNEGNNSAAYDLRGGLCYVKIEKGMGDMVATGYTSQPESIAPVLAGKYAAVKYGIGTGSLTINTGYNQWATGPILGGSSSVVDSYEDSFHWAGPLSTSGNLMHYLLDLGRGSDRNGSGVYGTIQRGL